MLFNKYYQTKNKAFGFHESAFICVAATDTIPLISCTHSLTFWSCRLRVNSQATVLLLQFQRKEKCRRRVIHIWEYTWWVWIVVDKVWFRSLFVVYSYSCCYTLLFFLFYSCWIAMPIFTNGSMGVVLHWQPPFVPYLYSTTKTKKKISTHLCFFSSHF